MAQLLLARTRLWVQFSVLKQTKRCNDFAQTPWPQEGNLFHTSQNGLCLRQKHSRSYDGATHTQWTGVGMVTPAIWTKWADRARGCWVVGRPHLYCRMHGPVSLTCVWASRDSQSPLPPSMEEHWDYSVASGASELKSWAGKINYRQVSSSKIYDLVKFLG